MQNFGGQTRCIMGDVEMVNQQIVRRASDNKKYFL